MATTPELIEDLNTYERTVPQPVVSIPASVITSCTTAIPQPQMKHTIVAAFVTPFQYSPYKNGARNAPAKAPHETPIICAINVTSGCASLKMAIIAETSIKKTINKRIIVTCFLSDISFFDAGLITSNVNVELEVKTNDEKC